MNKLSRSFLQIRIIYVVTTIFLVALSVYTFIKLKNLTDSYDLINHTTQVTHSLQNISADIFQAESGKRGFLLSGDSSHLAKRNAALFKLSSEQQVLCQLISDNNQQLQCLTKLELAIKVKVKSILDVTASKDKTLFTFYTQLNIRDGMIAMDNVTENIDAMIAVESSLLSNRKNEFTKLSYVTPIFMIVFFLGALIILWTSYLKLINALLKSKSLHKELISQNKEKENRAAELDIANQKLNYESNEKENRAAELVIANEKLKHESSEKENRAAELVIANKELAFQVEEKENRAIELISTNKELQLFAQIASHDLQEPLIKIQMFTSRIKEKDFQNISETGKAHFLVIEDAAERMQTLIQDLIAYAQTNDEERSFEETNLTEIINEVIEDLSEIIAEKGAIIESSKLCNAYIIPFQFRQLMTNLISNSLKFSKPEIPSHIIITSLIENGSTDIYEKLSSKKKYCHITFSDNGIGFEEIYNKKIFEIFQRLHGKGIYKGTGIGLAIVKKIVENHKGIITAVGKPNEGAKFDIYLPTK